MNITVNRNPTPPQREVTQAPPHGSAFDKRIGAWGRVNTLNCNDNTVDVILDNGVYLSRVPVASKEWVISDEDLGEDAKKGFNAGERDLPPIHARVFVFMPTFSFADCFVAPFSGFNTIDRNASSPFMDDDRENIKERITPSGWHITNDYITGSHKAVSPDEKTSLEIDYGTEDEPKDENPELHLNLFENIKADVIAEKSVVINAFDEVSIEHKKGESCKITVYDTEIVIKNGEVSIKPKETTIEVDGNAVIKTTGNTEIEATGDVSVKGVNVDVEATANATIKALKAKITGGSLEVGGVAAPNAQGAFCGLPACLFTGAVHIGNLITGT